MPARLSRSRRSPDDARRVLRVRGARGLVDGLVSVILPTYLGLLGLSAVRIGLVSTATLIGSAVLTLAVALGAGRWRRRSVLLGAGVLMVGTGLGFAASSTFADAARRRVPRDAQPDLR